jgi:AAA domain-containing protein
MGRRRRRETTLPAPYLRRVWLDRLLVEDWEAYPFCLPIFRDEFDLSFDSAITIIVGENGSGKSTILEGIAGLSLPGDAGVLRGSARVRGSGAGGVADAGRTCFDPVLAGCGASFLTMRVL